MYEKKDLLIIFLIALSLFLVLFLFPTKKIEFNIGKFSAIVNENYKSIIIKINYTDKEKLKYRIYPFFAKVYIQPIYYRDKIGIDKSIKPILIKNNKEHDLSKLGEYNLLTIDYIFIKKKYDLYILDGNLPVVNIDSSKKNEKIGPDKKVPVSINIFFNSNSFILNNKDALIRKRGFFEKKYNLWFSKPVSIFGLPNRKKWSLVGNTRDLVGIRDKFAFDLFGKINSSHIYPRTNFIELFINGNYKGIYIIEEVYDRELFGYGKYKKEHFKPALIYRCDESIVFRADFNSLLEGTEKGSKAFYEKFINYFKQIEPDVKKQDYLSEIWDLVFFILHSNDEDFYNKENGIYSKMDINNLIDVFLLLQLVKNMDGSANNLYFSRKETLNKDEKSLFVISAWDNDWSFGHYMTNKIDPYGIIGIDTGKINILFQRIFKSFYLRGKMKERWVELRKDKWSNKNINDLIKQYINDIKYAYNRMDNQYIYDNSEKRDFSQEDYINFMSDWINLRLSWLDDYFNKLDIKTSF